MAPMSSPPAHTSESIVSFDATVGEVMTPAPFTVDEKEKLHRAHAMMRKHRIRHIPVVREGELVGILSERDALLVESVIGAENDLEVVSDAMTPAVYTTTADAKLRDVARVMAAEKYGCAVVMQGARVAGIFTATDALRFIVAALP